MAEETLKRLGPPLEPTGQFDYPEDQPDYQPKVDDSEYPSPDTATSRERKMFKFRSPFEYFVFTALLAATVINTYILYTNDFRDPIGEIWSGPGEPEVANPLFDQELWLHLGAEAALFIGLIASVIALMRLPYNSDY